MTRVPKSPILYSHLGVQRKMLLQVVFLSFALITLAAITVESAQQPEPDCPTSCGNLNIPFPFGTRAGCYLDPSFLVTCRNSSKPFLQESDIDVLSISTEGELRVSTYASYFCNNQSDVTPRWFDYWIITSSRFPISHDRNVFTAVGCDTYAYIQGSLRQKYDTGCMSRCSSIDDVVNGSCSGMGCCQTPIPRKVIDANVTVRSFNEHTGIREFNPCGFAFIVEKDFYNFSSGDLFNLSNVREFPVVLDWAISNMTCKDAAKTSNSLTTYACGRNTECYDSDIGPGYRCNCTRGYHGNPYLQFGCQDINECQNHHNCTHICGNTSGGYNCSCPKGYYGDGIIGGKGCIADEDRWRSIKIYVGLSMSFVAVLLVICFTYMGVQKRNTTKKKEKFFKENGGVMLQQLLSKGENSTEHPAKVFSEEELKRATNNFNPRHVIGRGGYGTVYKGTLEDKRVVAIKKSKVVDQGQIEQFVSEVIILSQINHPNVVKLLGCCLETPVPLLVYEFVTNNTLFHHLHGDGLESLLTWEIRLKIATETAGALAHMHSTTQIIHRDIKSANILLNDDYTAKVADFGISKFVPLGQTHLTTLVQGTFGYIDPEYFHSGNLTEKSDVYSFGVVLVELLTGQKVLSPERPEKDRSLAMYFISSLENDHLIQVLGDRVKRGGDPAQLRGVAELANQCLRLKGEERPKMEQVKEELEALQKLANHSRVENGSNLEDLEERVALLSDNVDYYDSSISIGFDSLRTQAVLQIDSGGR